MRGLVILPQCLIWSELGQKPLTLLSGKCHLQLNFGSSVLHSGVPHHFFKGFLIQPFYVLNYTDYYHCIRHGGRNLDEELINWLLIVCEC